MSNLTTITLFSQIPPVAFFLDCAMLFVFAGKFELKDETENSIR